MTTTTFRSLGSDQFWIKFFFCLFVCFSAADWKSNHNVLGKNLHYSNMCPRLPPTRCSASQGIQWSHCDGSCCCPHGRTQDRNCGPMTPVERGLLVMACPWTIWGVYLTRQTPYEEFHPAGACLLLDLRILSWGSSPRKTSRIWT